MHPILGQFQGFTFYTYGSAMLVSLLLIYVLAIRRLDTISLTREQLDDLGLIVLTSIWVGGGIFSFLFSGSYDIHHFMDTLSIAKLQQASTLPISFSVTLLLFLYCWRKKLSFLEVLDFLMPLFVLGYGVQRILGCFSAGCCYGKPSDVFWAVRFPDTLGVGPPVGIPVHPTQLYLALTAFLTYWLMRRWQIQQPPKGTLTCLGLVGLFGFYFLVVFVRGDLESVHKVGSMPINQLFAGMISLVGVVGFIGFSSREKLKETT